MKDSQDGLLSPDQLRSIYEDLRLIANEIGIDVKSFEDRMREDDERRRERDQKRVQEILAERENMRGETAAATPEAVDPPKEAKSPRPSQEERDNGRHLELE
jgi:hypothetical protein